MVSYDFQSKNENGFTEKDKSLYQMGFIYLDKKGTTLYGLKKGQGLGDPDKLVSYDLKTHKEKNFVSISRNRRCHQQCMCCKKIKACRRCINVKEKIIMVFRNLLFSSADVWHRQSGKGTRTK